LVTISSVPNRAAGPRNNGAFEHAVANLDDGHNHHAIGIFADCQPVACGHRTYYPNTGISG
jgi:hypothetical protein